MTFAIWITGLPGSGKSAITKELLKLIDAEWLRLDDIRKIITPKPSYTDKERIIVYKALAYSGFLLTKNKINVIFDATDNLGIGRKTMKKLIKNSFVVQLECPLKICEKRESKRKDKAGISELYSRARKGIIKIPGLGQKYIKEKKPKLLIQTGKISAKLSAQMIKAKLRKLKW